MSDKRIASIAMTHGNTHRGKMFIDATVVGNLLAGAEVSDTAGREPGDLRLPALIEPFAEVGKVDWNHMHSVGSELPGANWEYPQARSERRREIEAEHELSTRGLPWTMGHHPRVPEAIRSSIAKYRLTKNKFAENGRAGLGCSTFAKPGGW